MHCVCVCIVLPKQFLWRVTIYKLCTKLCSLAVVLCYIRLCYLVYLSVRLLLIVFPSLCSLFLSVVSILCCVLYFPAFTRWVSSHCSSVMM